MTRRRAPLAVVLMALFTVACAGPSGVLDESGLDDSDTGQTDETGEADGTGRGASAGPGEPTVVDELCLGELDDRCGSLLLPQSETATSRIAVHFRIIGAEEPGRPVVVLASTGPEVPLESLDLPGRPLVELSSRGSWPSEPPLSCPEIGWLPTNADNDDWGTVIGRCAERLDGSGIDVVAYDAAHRAGDIALAIDLLGFEEVDVIAAGREALDLAEVGDASWLRRVLYVQPVGPEADAVVARAWGIRRGLETVWALCGASPPCETHGPVGDFLDVLAALDDDPIVVPPGSADPTGTDRILDDVDWLDRVAGDLQDPAAALFLPEVHRALRDRDLDLLARYLAGTSGSLAADGFTSRCAHWSRTETVEPPPHAVFTRWIDHTRAFVTEFCEAWAPGLAPPDSDRLPAGMSVVAEGGLGATPEDLRPAGEVIVSPTVASPAPACVAAAARTWFDDGEATDDPACDETPTVRRRDTAFALIDAVYEYELEGSGVVVHTVVPDTWIDRGFGVWDRDADPLDLTTLDVYVLPDTDLGRARDWFIAGWELDDPTASETVVGGRTWQLVTAVDPWSAGQRQRYRAAFSDFDGIAVGLILWAGADELAELTDSVLEPALDAVRLTD